MKSRQDVHCRWLIRRDWTVIHDMERRSAVYPILEEEEMKKLLSSSGVVGMVAYLWPGERIVGYALLTVTHGVVEVRRFVVDPAHQRRGIGRAMVAKLRVRYQHPDNPHKIRFVVPETDFGAIDFCRAVGFKGVGVRKNAFPLPLGVRDGFVFER